MAEITALVYGEGPYETGESLLTKKVTYRDGRTWYTGNVTGPSIEIGEGLYSCDIKMSASWDGRMSVVLCEWPDHTELVSVHGRRITGPRTFADLVAQVHYGSERPPRWACG